MNEAQFQTTSIQEISRDRVRGASELARRCLAILAEYARRLPVTRCGRPTPADMTELKEKLEAFARALQATRPSMAPVQNLVERWLGILGEGPEDSLEGARAHAVASAQGLTEESIRAVVEVGRHASGLVKPGQTVITHSFSSTMLKVFESLAERHFNCATIRAIVTESRPLLEGSTLASHLSKLGIPTDYITDAQMGLFAGNADMAMVGADSVLGDGSVVNKAGTYLLALATQDKSIPFYVCHESFKCIPRHPVDVELEEMDAAELHSADLTHVTTRNVYFDITPARLITGRITENGITKNAPLVV